MLLLGLEVPAAAAQERTVKLYLFWQEGCPQCEKLMKPFLRALRALTPELVLIEKEVTHEVASLKEFRDAAAKFGVQAPYVPAVYLGTRAWVGYNDTIKAEIEAQVAECVRSGCIDAMVDPLPESDRPPPESEVTTRLFGRVRLGGLPLVLATALLAFLDGVNPCSLWVLTFLLGMVVHTGSRKKVLAVGTAFLSVTALIYGLFMAGVSQVLRLAAYATWIRVGVAVLACAMGAVNMKDFFAFKKGVSLTISDDQRRRIGTRARTLLSSDRSVPSLMVSTALLAAGVAVVEFPCTAGFPVVWSNLLSQARVGTVVFLGLLGLYLVVYLGDEIAIVAASTIAFRRINLQESQGRFLKLLGGVVMATLAAVMVIDPALMESALGVLVVFGGSASVSVLILLADRAVRRRRGAGGQP